LVGAPEVHGTVTEDVVGSCFAHVVGPGIFVDRPETLPGDIFVKDYLEMVYSLLRYNDKEREAITFQYLLPEHMELRIKDLKTIQKSELLLVMLYHKRSGIYIINDLCRGFTSDFVILLNDILEGLAYQGASVIQLTTVGVNEIDRKSKISIAQRKEKYWKDQVDGLREKISKSKGV